jgi:hypothetical protein
MSNCILAIFYETLLQLINFIYLFIRQPYLSVERMCPFILKLSYQSFGRRYILKQILAVCSRIHKIAMHSWKHTINDLLEVVFKFSLSLLAIGSNSTLNPLYLTCKRSSRKLMWSISGSSLKVFLYN